MIRWKFLLIFSVGMACVFAAWAIAQERSRWVAIVISFAFLVIAVAVDRYLAFERRRKD